MNELQKYSGEINKLCYRFNVKRLYAFGSVLTDKFDQTSDIDLIVEFEPVEIARYADNYYDFKFSLEDVFRRSVDLLEEKAIKNPYLRQSVDKQRRLVYVH